MSQNLFHLYRISPTLSRRKWVTSLFYLLENPVSFRILNIRLKTVPENLVFPVTYAIELQVGAELTFTYDRFFSFLFPTFGLGTFPEMRFNFIYSTVCSYHLLYRHVMSSQLYMVINPKSFYIEGQIIRIYTMDIFEKWSNK